MKNLLSIKDVMLILQKSRSAIYRLMEDKGNPLPHLKMGRHIRFYESDLVAWIEKFKVPEKPCQ